MLEKAIYHSREGQLPCAQMTICSFVTYIPTNTLGINSSMLQCYQILEFWRIESTISDPLEVTHVPIFINSYGSFCIMEAQALCFSVVSHGTCFQVLSRLVREQPDAATTKTTAEDLEATNYLHALAAYAMPCMANNNGPIG